MERAEIEAIVAGQHADPFAVRGVHRVNGSWLARAFIPNAERVEALDLELRPLGKLTLIHEAGLFEGRIETNHHLIPIYRASAGSRTWDEVDPYTFPTVLGELDDWFSADGSHLQMADRLGAHLITHMGVNGTHFAVWAPNAQRVSVIGPFNEWDGRRHVMRRRFGSGIFEIFLPDLGPGTLYKYEIIDSAGNLLPAKSDPFAFAAEMRPGTSSRTVDLSAIRWTDEDWMQNRIKGDRARVPISIYEVHLGSWKRHPDGSFLSYDELAEQLVAYASDMGFTHIELMPVSEHPLDESWGYQPTGLFAPTSRFGDPIAFARFVDHAHRHGIGIILDWDPAHFPTDAHGLARFDGTALYEHDDSRKGFHPDWNTAIYNFGRNEVANMLVNNALFWAERYHIDGLRVDAVSSMLYLDYSRKPGEWLPNEFGGRENLQAVAFLKRVNTVLRERFSGIVTIAEESTSWPGVTSPCEAGGLGFSFKWNMGFMNDTLRYLARDPVYRSAHHDEITFGLMYAFSERFVLPLSHDEVVHGKGSLLTKMAGDDWLKFATLRAYYAAMWGYPGKKLLFMGQDFAQRNEWSESRGLDWGLLDSQAHEGIRSLVRDLNKLYRNTPALYARDCDVDGFQWLIVDDRENSVFAWARRGEPDQGLTVVIANFTPIERPHYRVPFPKAGRWRQVINTDAAKYWGAGHGDEETIIAEDVPMSGQPASLTLLLAPSATMIFNLD